MERTINSRGNQYTVLYDDEDYALLLNYKSWCIAWKDNRLSGVKFRERTGIKSTKIMHRIIMNVTDSNIQVDHINHNTLDNRKENLRLCSRQQNSMNRSKSIKQEYMSNYLGVSWDMEELRFVAAIGYNRKVINLGRYNDDIDAAKKYDSAAYYYFKEFANLNFKDEIPEPFVPPEDYHQIIIDGIYSFFEAYESGYIEDMVTFIQFNNPLMNITKHKIVSRLKFITSLDYTNIVTETTTKRLYRISQ